jgi:hypothetical protein
MILASAIIVAFASVPNEIEQAEEAAVNEKELTGEALAQQLQREAMYAEYEALIEREEALTREHEELSSRGRSDDTAYDLAWKEITHGWAEFFDTFGWELYDTYLYHDIDHVIQSTEGGMLGISDMLYWLDIGKIPVDCPEEIAALRAIFEDRMRLNQEFLGRLTEIQQTRQPYDIRALSGELELMYFLAESQFELSEQLQEVQNR